MTGCEFSQFDRGVSRRDLSDADGDDPADFCGLCGTALDDADRDLCSRCEWEIGEG